LVYSVKTPWDTTAAAVQFIGGHTIKESKKRYMLSGAAFFEFENGKIRNLRFYVGAGETEEVTGPFEVFLRQRVVHQFS
jgi:hypothetical protein